MSASRRVTMMLSVLAIMGLVAACGDSGGGGGGGGGGTTAGQVTLDARCKESAGVKAPADFKVGLVTDIGKVDDRTFNQYAYEGMKAAETCFGVKTSYIETAAESDYAKNIQTTLDGKPNVVVTVGFLLANDTLAAAQKNTGVKWIGIDQFQTAYPDNYIGVEFREDQGGYLAGTLAGLLTKTGVVGVVGGRQDVPAVVRFVNAFETGAKAANAKVKVLKIYNESFTDPAKGASDAKQFIGEGADVIFGAGGKTGSGGVVEATAEGKWGIGVDQDEYISTFNGGTAAGAKYLASSAVKRVDLAVFDNIAAAVKGSFKGGLFSLTAANGGITYAPFHDAKIPSDVANKLETVRKGLAAGTTDTGVDPVTGLPK
jgi:basic membrane lipoprotein Med (substrate-binding protein (PBP1-ABC) superfamily)